MLTNSKKLNSQFASLTGQEAFRAFWKALSDGNHDLVDEIGKQLPNEVKHKTNFYGTLMFQKMNLYNLYLIQKADLAIYFYNSFLGQMFGVEGSKEMFSPEYAEKWLEETKNIKQELKEIDDKAGGTLKIELFEAMEDLANYFDFWLYLIKKIDKDKLWKEN